MSTDNFNLIDIIIAFLRFRKLKKYIDNNDILLDFGCGYQAYFLRHIASSLRIGVGVDIHLQPKKIRNLLLKKYKFENKLPFKTNYFSKISMFAVLEHVQLSKVKILFQEFARVLKPEGIVILTTPTPKSKNILEFLAFKLHVISSDEIGDHKKYYSKDDISELLAKTGFIILHYETFMLGLNSFYILKKSVT